MKKLFILFGQYLSNAYFEGGIDQAIEYFNNFPLSGEGQAHVFDPSNPNAAELLLEVSDGWDGYALITEQEYVEFCSRTKEGR